MSAQEIIADEYYDQPWRLSKAKKKFLAELPPTYREENKPGERWFRMEKPQ